MTWLRENESRKSFAHHFVSYLLRQTPRMHWDLRWSDVETLLVSTLKHLWGQKLHPVGVLKSSVFLCRNVALPKALLYSAICSGAIVLILLLPWGRRWHRTAKGSTSTYHRQYAVYNRIRRQRSGGPLGIWQLHGNNLSAIATKPTFNPTCTRWATKTGSSWRASQENIQSDAWSQAKLGCNVARNPIPAVIPPKDLGIRKLCPRSWIMLNLSDLRIWIAFNKEHNVSTRVCNVAIYSWIFCDLSILSWAFME